MMDQFISKVRWSGSGNTLEITIPKFYQEGQQLKIGDMVWVQMKLLKDYPQENKSQELLLSTLSEQIQKLSRL